MVGIGLMVLSPRPNPKDPIQSMRNVQDAIEQLEEEILTSPKLFWSRTLVKEEALVDHLDQIRLNLPRAFAEAEEVLQRREEILEEASRYADELVAAAQRRAQQLLDESAITRQAETRASQILYRTQQEQEAMRQKARHEVTQLQQEADRYVDRVLQDLEQRLMESLQVVRQGRQQVKS